MKLSTSQKGFSPILIVLLIVATLTGGYFLYTQQTKPLPQPIPQQTPTPSPAPALESESSPSAGTTNWRTYVNTKYGFSLRYPEDKNFKVQENNKGISIGTPNSGFGLFISIFDNPKKLTPRDWIKENFNAMYEKTTINGKRVSIENLQLKDKIVANQPAVEKTFGELAEFGTGATILFTSPNKEKIFEISGSELGVDLLDQILSTFKFIP